MNDVLLSTEKQLTKYQNKIGVQKANKSIAFEKYGIHNSSFTYHNQLTFRLSTYGNTSWAHKKNIYKVLT